MIALYLASGILAVFDPDNLPRYPTGIRAGFSGDSRQRASAETAIRSNVQAAGIDRK